MSSKLTRLFQFMDTLGIGERDPFGNPIVFKRLTMIVMGFLTYSRLRFYNKTIIKGTEYLDELRKMESSFCLITRLILWM